MDEKVLVSSAEKNCLHPDGVLMSSDQEGWGIRKSTLSGGVQSGVELIEVDNGALKFRVIPTRGMSILDATWKGHRIGWDSPVKQVVHPQFVNLADQGGLGWLSGFNELMVRCGVAFAGGPGEDNGEMLTLHGRIGNTPASEVEVLKSALLQTTLRVRGLVEEKRFKFGVFELRTEVSTVLGSSSLVFQDRLTNRSEYAQEYQMIYHTNFGPPLLGRDSEFVAPIHRVSPFNDYAAKSLGTFGTYLEPTKGYGEQVYCMTLHHEKSGESTVLLRNADGDLGVAMRYDTTSLPYFNLWKNTDTLTDGYVTGLEPATGYPSNRSHEREAGRVPKLEPGQSITFRMELELLDAAGVERVGGEINAIAGEKTTIVEKQSIL